MKPSPYRALPRPAPVPRSLPLALGLALCLAAPWSRAQQVPLTTVADVATGVYAGANDPGSHKPGDPIIGGVSGGSSGILSYRILWVYKDTYVIDPHSTEPDDDTAYIIPSSYAHATLDLGDLPAYVSPQGLPYQLIPYTQAEWDYNSASKSRDDRYALWPSAVLTTDDSHVRIVYTKAHVTKNAGLDGPNQYDTVGTGFAGMTLDDLQAKRDFSRETQSGLTFSGDTRPFGRSGAAMVKSGGMDTVYLFDCTNDDGDNCYMARISAPTGTGDAAWGELLDDPAKFLAWNGTQWTSDLGQAKPVQHLHASDYGWTMAWNGYATNPETGQPGAYIGLYDESATSDGKTISTGHIKLVVAARPEGPWSDPVEAYYLDPNAGNDYAHYDLMQVHDVRLHPELDQGDGSKIYVTASAPNPDKYGAWNEQLYTYQFTLQNASPAAAAANASR